MRGKALSLYSLSMAHAAILRPSGALLDVYQDGYEFIGHSTIPAKAADPQGFRITIGGPQCAQPYSASVFNISAMSFGSLSANAIRALNAGARRARTLKMARPKMARPRWGQAPLSRLGASARCGGCVRR